MVDFVICYFLDFGIERAEMGFIFNREKYGYFCLGVDSINSFF